MEIELFAGDARAIISPQGGYVTNLSDARGDILFPKRTLTNGAGEQKVRGGAHVCYPNFGPGGASGLGQHGFARTSNWNIKETSDTSATLSLDGQGDYRALQATLRYDIQDGVFTSALTIRNTGDVPVAVSPAFHPYFWHQPGTELVVDEERVVPEDLEGTVFIDGDTHHLQLGPRQLTVRSSNLPRWAEWTDQLGSYVCVEPTQSGYAFAEDIARADELAPAEMREYRYEIMWRGNS